MKSFACRRQHLSLWLSYLVVFSLRLRRSRKWRSVIHWTDPQTTALRTTKPTSTNWWSTVRLASRREPLWSAVANRCSDQVRQRYLHRRLEVKWVSGINQSAWSTSDMTDDALWLVLSAFQVFSLNPPCSSMSKTTCTSLKRSRSAPSWSFPSSRAGNASSRLYPFCHIYSSTQKMKNNITETSFFSPLLFLLPALSPFCVCSSARWTMFWGGPMLQSTAWHQAFSHGTSAKLCTSVKGSTPALFSSTPTTRLMWRRLSEASNSLALAKTSVRKLLQL